MDLKEILIHIDTTEQCPTRLDLAVALAEKHEARLTGLAVISHRLLEPARERLQTRRTEIRNLFSEKTSRAAVAAQWLEVDCGVLGGDIAEIINLHAHYADLVIVGQTEPHAAERGIPKDLPERLVVGSGRPVLIVPYAGTPGNIGERVFIAWIPGRESTRAVNDAIPFLAKAEDICVMEVTPSTPETMEGEKLCAHLAQHAITARAKQILASDVSVGDTLLNRVTVEGSTLLVMGACAHSRLGSTVLGDVARHILQHMTVPVLMSH